MLEYVFDFIEHRHGNQVLCRRVVGAGVFICNDCVALCAEVIKQKHEIVPDQPGGDRQEIKVWESVDDDLRGWVGEARRRGLSWERFG